MNDQEYQALLEEKLELENNMQIALDFARESTEQIKLMFDSIPMGCHMVDGNLRVIDCNDAALEMFQASSKKEYVENFYRVSPEYQPNGMRSEDLAKMHIREALKVGIKIFEWEHQTFQGDALPLEITVKRVRLQGDDVTIAYMRDLREFKAMLQEIKKTENDLRVARDVAEESNQAKSKFLATMSHEIRTPMNAILGIAEMQLENEGLSVDMKATFEKIYNSGDLLLRIINDILDLSKIEAGKMELESVQYQFASMISDAANLNIMRFEDKAIRFSLKIDENIPSVLVGDELRIKQILSNLLSNAFKYTEKGRVELEVNIQETGENQATLRFRVSDTGQGMTKEQLDKLFSEYTRFNLEANRKTVGTGLGLAITRNLVALMGGEILAESMPGKGSIFTVYLPQGVPGEEVLGLAVKENLQKLKTFYMSHKKKSQIIRDAMPYGKVLVVDDMDANLYVARLLLQPYELQVETVKSGFEAIQKIKNGNTYDIIFMDHMMPEMDGMEARRILFEEEGYTRPIVALTANAVSGQAEMFLEHGFDGFLSKPIDTRHLNDILNKMIRDKQSAEVLAKARHSSTAGEVNLAENQKLVEIFVEDVEKALVSLDKIMGKGLPFDDMDFEGYTIVTHGLKTPLTTIGESDLSAIAFELEKAGRDQKTEFILARTPEFVEKLQELVKRYAKKVDDLERSDQEDCHYLQEQLLQIKEACENYDKKTAKEAMKKLKEKRWTANTRKQLSMISEDLLCGDFDEAIELIGGLMY